MTSKLGSLFSLTLIIVVALLTSRLIEAKSGKQEARHASFYYRATTNNSECLKYTDCGSCVEHSSCVWCTNEKYCSPGSWYGASCEGWKSGQCSTDGLALLVGIGLLIALLVLISLAIIFCCVFCRRSTASYETLDEEAQAQQQQAQAQANPVSAHPITDLHRQEMEEKYGLSKR